jgi:hypothetical protein
MSRFIVIVLLLIILRLAFKSFTGQLKVAVFGPPEPPRPPKAPQVSVQTLVQCSACGVYVDSSRTLKGAGVGEGMVFCSEECRSGKA